MSYSRLSSRSRLLVPVAGALSVLVVVALGLVRGYESVQGERVTVLRSSVTGAIDITALAVAAASLILGVALLFRRQWLGAIALVLFAPFLLLAFVATVFVGGLGNYNFSAALRLSDGSTYYFAESSFLQGQVLELHAEDEQGTFTITGRRLVQTNGDSPRMTAQVIRPTHMVDGHHENRLYVSPD